MRILIERFIAAPVADVWAAWNDPADIVQWNAASDDWHTTRSTVDLRIGGVFTSRMEAKDGSFGFGFAGTYTSVVDYKLIEFSMGDTRTVRVEFAEQGGGVLLRQSFDSEATHSIEQQRDGWQAILNRFANHVEMKLAEKKLDPASSK
ncbi:MAG: ATPase [Burkholderiales bacterium]|nr:MAG: ATPase [Betaproteobacteria bacterium]TAG83934.1 MAG: ATPase [Burkholderiales bacterium]